MQALPLFVPLASMLIWLIKHNGPCALFAQHSSGTNYSKNQIFLWVEELPFPMLSRRYKALFCCLEVLPHLLPMWLSNLHKDDLYCNCLLKYSLSCLLWRNTILYLLLWKVLQKHTQLIILCSPVWMCCNYLRPVFEKKQESKRSLPQPPWSSTSKLLIGKQALGQAIVVPDLMLLGLGKIMQNAKGVLTSRVVKIPLIDSASMHKWLPESAAAELGKTTYADSLCLCISGVEGTIPLLPCLGMSHHTGACKIITDFASEVFSGCKARISQSLAVQCLSNFQCILVSVSLQAQQGA